MFNVMNQHIKVFVFAKVIPFRVEQPNPELIETYFRNFEAEF